MTLSLLTCDLGAVFELIGATSASALAYILPPLCYIKLSTRSWKTVPAVACVVFGFAVMFISVIQAGSKMIRSESTSFHATQRWGTDLYSVQMKGECRPAERIPSAALYDEVVWNVGYLVGSSLDRPARVFGGRYREIMYGPIDCIHRGTALLLRLGITP
jgi:Transmembrane amino acid transporter protein